MYITFIVYALTHTVFYFVNEKIVEFMGTSVVEFLDMFVLFCVCHFSSGNRTVGTIDMVRVLTQNLA